MAVIPSGLERFSLLFVLVCVFGWLYVLDAWWGLATALALCAPVGVAFSLIPPAIVGTIRPILGDVVTTWSFVAGGIALGAYGLAALEGASLALVGLCAGAVFFGGASLFWARLNAVRRRIASVDSRA